MKKNNLQQLPKTILLFLAVTFSFIIQNVNAQTHDVCPDANTMNVKSTCVLETLTFSAPATEYWVKFTATDDTVIIIADTNIYNAAHLHEINVYSGSCSSLTLLQTVDATDTLQFIQNGLLAGSDYYIQIKRGDSSVCDKFGCSFGERDFRLCIRGGTVQSALLCVMFANGTTECCDPSVGGNTNEPLDINHCISQICTDSPICVGVNAPGMSSIDPNYHQIVTVTAPGSSIAPPSGYMLDDIFINNNCFPLSYPVEGVYPVNYSFFDVVAQTTISYTVYIHVVDQIPDFTFTLNGNRFCDEFELCQAVNIWFNDTTTHIYFSIDNFPTPPIDVAFTLDQANDLCGEAGANIDLCPGPHTAIVLACSPSQYNTFILYPEVCNCDTIIHPFEMGPFVQFISDVKCDTVCFANTTECTNFLGTSDFVWDFGDGTTDTIFNPNCHIYEQAGFYNVSLTLYIGGICDQYLTYSQLIQVGKPIEMEIEGPLNTCCDTVSYFCANCVGDVTWEFFTDSIISYFSSGNPITFVWPAGSNGIAFEVTFTDSVGCVSDTTIVLEPCCTPLELIPNGAIQTNHCNPVYSSEFFSDSVFFGGINNFYIILNNDLIVDTSINITNCQIRVAPGRKIIVEDSITLRIRGTKVKALCPEMWDGIYASTANSHIFISGGLSPNPNDDSEIWHAINGIVSTNGAMFTIQDTKLNNNYISLQVSNFNGIHPGVINTTSIQTTNANLYFPHVGERMKYGVKIANVKGITIGVNYTNFVNEFSNMDYGIYATESSVSVYGNRFQGIRRPLNVPPCPTCIDPIGTAIFMRSKLSLVTLTLGDNTNANRNEFNQCYIGAKVYDNVNMRAQRNTLKNIEEAGLFTHFNFSKTHVIKNNTINFTKIGFHGLDVSNCNFTINLNTFFNSNTSCTGNCIDNTAILIENTFQSSITANIFNNIIDRKRVGIWLRNVVSPSPWPNNSVKVFGNTVNFGALNNSLVPFYYGVRIDNCRNILVQDQHVFKLGVNPNSNVFQSIRGIRLLNSQGCTVTKNLIEKCGAGISAFGSCSPSNLECNNLDKNFYGFTFEGPAGTAAVGTQVVGSLPTGNTWTTLSGGFDLFGAISPGIDWYHQSGGYAPSTFFTLAGSLSGFGNTTLPSPLSDRCMSFFSPTPPDDREARLGKIVRDENTFGNNADEFKLFDKKYAHKELQDNPSLLSLGTNDDIDYQNFYTVEQNNSVGIFNEVENLLFNRQFAQALQLLAGISPQNTWEYNLKRAYEIAPYFLDETLTPTSSMLSELEDIALQNSLSGGPGVTAARVMLQWDLEDEVNEPRSSVAENNEKIVTSETVKIFPNPADEKFTATFDKSIDKAVLELVDITGKTVKTLNILQQKSVEVDISTLSSGVYFIELQRDDTVIFREKLIKSK